VALEVPVVREVVFLLNCAVRQLRRDLTMSSLRATQIGNRPVAFDGYPLVGEAGLEGLWVMTGTYRDGLHLSPLLAPEVARRMLQEEPEVDLDLFAPARPPIQAMSREQVVEAAVAHLVATGEENDWHVPVEWPRIITKNLLVAYKRFADELDDLYTPPPELLAAARVHESLLAKLRDYYAAAKTAHDVLPTAVAGSPA
jgi:glycine oxidase